MKENDSMVTAMAMDGNTQRCQEEDRNCWFSPPSWPQDGVGGLMPTPMNDSAASVKIASGMPKLTFFFQAEDGIRDDLVTGVQTCAFRSGYVAVFSMIAET